MDTPPCLPVIDILELDGPQYDQAVETVVKAAQKFGFFQVVNHGMPVEFLDELKESVYSFFNQPEEKKAVDIRKGGSLGRPVVTYTKATDGPDPVDVLVLTDEVEALEYWPDLCKEVTLKFQKFTSKLAERLLRILMNNLGVTLDDSMVDTYIGAVNISMNHYPIHTKDEDREVGAGKHTDNNTLTVLLQDHIGGLFGKLNEDGDMKNNYKGEWVEIKPIPGALVILVGDALQILSNGKYVAGYHYVKTTGRVTRVSIPAFMSPISSAKIGPLPQLLEKDGDKPRYKEFLYEEYLTKAAENYYGDSQGVNSVIRAFEIST